MFLAVTPESDTDQTLGGTPMLLKLLKWLRGYLYVRISGTAPERFINLCCNRNITVWNLIKKDDYFQFCIIAKQYKQLKLIARKTRIVPRIQRKIGLPFFLHKYRKRKGFLVGVILSVALIYILSLFIWDISILGGSKYTSVAMLKFLNEKEVYTGIQKKKVNCQEIEETIRLAYHDIGWVSAEIRGTRLIIKLSERNMPQPAKAVIAPSHIIATKDAIVKSIITRAGTPLVREGDIVKKGDILVSGIVTVEGDFDEILSKEPVVADADIRCSSYYNYYDAFPMTYTDKIYTKSEKKGYYIMLFGKKLFLYSPRYSYLNYDIIVNEKTLHVTQSFYLPFRYGTITTKEFEREKKTYSEKEAIAIAEKKLQRYFNKLIDKDVLISENNVKISIENNYCITQGRIMVEEPAWEYKTIQENEWRIEPTDEHNGNNH
jgi:similar to stage IV sporulation protein